MKKNLYVLLAILFSCSLMFSCSDDNNDPDPEPGPGPDPTPKEILDPEKVNGTYGSGENILVLTYGGANMAGKEVIFQASDKEKANITLKAVIPGETTTVLTNVELSGSETQFSFGETTITTTSGWELTYKGVVVEGRLELNVDAKMLANDLVGFWELDEESPLFINWESTEKLFYVVSSNLIASGIEKMVAPLLPTVLETVTFVEDGSIVAEYIKKGDKETSPKNLVHYYIEDEKIRVVLNPTALIEIIDFGNIGGEDGGISMEDITMLLVEFNDLLVNGIPLAYTLEDGKLKVFLETELIMMLLKNENIISLVGDIEIDLSSIFPALGTMKISAFLTLLTPMINGTTLFDIGIILN